MAILRWLKKELRLHKTGIIAVLALLTSICIFLNSHAQGAKTDLQTDLLYKVGIMDATHSGFAANNSELMLQRSIGEWCLNNQQVDIVAKGGCGSNKVLLQSAAYQHDFLEGVDIQATEDASTSLAVFNALAPGDDLVVNITTGAVLFFQAAIIVIGLL